MNSSMNHVLPSPLQTVMGRESPAWGQAETSMSSSLRNGGPEVESGAVETSKAQGIIFEVVEVQWYGSGLWGRGET